MEITTGMSAPPIGMMIRTPSASETSTISQKVVPDWPLTSRTISSTRRMPSPRFTMCCMGKTTGLPEIRPCSLPKAMMEPVKVIAPMATPSDISIRLAA